MRISSVLRSAILLPFVVIFFSYCQQDPYQQGRVLYSRHCQSCHMEDGTGLGTNIPPLAKADYLTSHQDQFACIIRYGISDTIIVNGSTYTEPMAGIGKETLTEFQIANIINYINHAWGNELGFVKVEDLRQQLESCQ